MRGEVPEHPEELFLGGAAGEREPVAWEEVERIGSIRVVAALRGKGAGRNGSMEVEDLWAIARAKLVRDEPSVPPLPDGRAPCNIITFRGRSTLFGYLCTCTFRIWRNEHRRGAARPKETRVEDAAELTDERGSMREVLEPGMAGKIDAAISAAYTELTQAQQALLMLVFGQGLAKQEAGALVGLRPWEVTRSITHGMEVFRRHLLPVVGDDLGPELLLELMQSLFALIRKGPDRPSEPESK